MGVPKKHQTKSSVNQRRMHQFLEAPILTVCPKCAKPKKPHIVCPNCGFYKGVEVVNVLAKLEKKERKKREKEMKEAQKEQKEDKKEKPMTLEELSKKKF